MKTVKVQLPDGVAARLEAAAVAADVPVAAFAAVLLAKAIEEGGLAAVTPPQAVARTHVAVMGVEVPDEATVVALALALHRGDMEGSAALMDGKSLSLLFADALAWINRAGINELGPEGWEARLSAVLTEHAARGSASPGGDQSA